MENLLYIILSSFFLFSCSSSTMDKSTLHVSPSQEPFKLEVEADFFKDIKYGEYERNTFDFFGPVSNAPTPLIIFIHGGGFTGGDKSLQYNEIGFNNLANSILSHKVALANINYRFLEVGDKQGVLKPLIDSKRELQFISYHSKELNIDKRKILLVGSSAGAGTSLWIGLSDDMAHKEASDPVLKESTRVQGVVGLSMQATYDVMEWHQTVFKEYEAQGMNYEAILNLVGEETVLSFYGVTSSDELESEAVKQIRSKVDFLNLLTPDDPEVYVSNSDVPYTYPTDNASVLHHPLHAKALMDKAIIENIPFKAYIPQMGIDHTNGENIAEFMLRKLKK